MIKLLIFDLEGTLLDSMQFNMRVIQSLLRSENQNISESKIKLHLGLPVKEFLYKMFPDASSSEITRLLKKSKYLYFRELSHRPYALFDSTVEVLSILKERGYYLSIASNAPNKVVSKILKKYEIETLFDYVANSDLLEHKPSPDMILDTLNYFSLEAKEALMIGDSISDIKAAKQAKVKMLVAAYNNVLSKDHLCLIAKSEDSVSRIEYLPDAIKRISENLFLCHS